MTPKRFIIRLFLIGKPMLYSMTSSKKTASLNSGVLALAATLIIWASYFVALRSGAQSVLTSLDMAILRFLLPAVILIPVLIKSRARILAVKKRYLLGIAIGAGLPFYVLSVIASGHVQAVIGSLLVPGVSPVFVTLLAVVCYKERLAKRKISGLAIILAGIGLLISTYVAAGTTQGYLGAIFYIAAAACWAVYTVSVKMSQLKGIELAAVLNITAAIIVVGVLPFEIFTSNLAIASWQQILPQLLVMGVFCGLITVITYGHAINKLGAELSACWGATTPVIVCVLAFLILGEELDTTTVIAMAMIITGVVCANFKRRKR